MKKLLLALIVCFSCIIPCMHASDIQERADLRPPRPPFEERRLYSGGRDRAAKALPLQPAVEKNLGEQLRAYELEKSAAARGISQKELASIEAARPSLREERINAYQKDYDRQRFYTRLADAYNKEQEKSWFTRGRFKSPEELEAYCMPQGDNTLRNERLDAYKQAYGLLSREERKAARKQTSDMFLPWYTRVYNYISEKTLEAIKNLPKWVEYPARVSYGGAWQEINAENKRRRKFDSLQQLVRIQQEKEEAARARMWTELRAHVLDEE